MEVRKGSSGLAFPSPGNTKVSNGRVFFFRERWATAPAFIMRGPLRTTHLYPAACLRPSCLSLIGKAVYGNRRLKGGSVIGRLLEWLSVALQRDPDARCR